MSNPLSEYLGLLDELRTTIGSDPASLPPTRRLISQAGRLVCRGYSTNPTPLNASPLGATLRDICFDYNVNEGFDPPTRERLIEGGQCPTLYNVTTSFTRLRCDGAVQNISNTDNSRPGPISATFEETPFQSGGLDFVDYKFRLFDANGDNFRTISAALIVTCTPSTPTNFFEITNRNVQFVRVDGQPDNCGSPPPISNPGTAPSYTFGDVVVVQDDEGFDVPIEVGEPFIDEDGNIRIPFKIGDAEFDLLSVPGQGNQPKSDLPLSTGNTTGELNPDGTADALEEPAEGQERAGVLIEVVGEETKTGQIFGTAPYGVFPRVNGNATLLATSSEDSADIPGTSVRLLSRFTLLLTDVPGLNVDRVFVSLASPSFRYKLTTIFRNIEA